MYSCLVISVVVGVIMLIAIVVVSLSVLVPSANGSELSDVIVVDEDVLERCLPPGMIPESIDVTP